MDGRRVERRAPRRNPLYVMFLCLVAAVFVLLIVVIVLGAKLGAANKAAEAAEAQIEELQARIEAMEEQKEELPEPSLGGEDDKLDGEDMPAIDPGTVTQPTQPTQQENKKVTVDWLDLTGHKELTVLPEKLFSDYAVYYATDGVNLRGGPSTSHAKVQLVEKGEKVKAAAKDGEWTFVSVGSKFGWIKSEYLAATPPSEATAGSLRTN